MAGPSYFLHIDRIECPRPDREGKQRLDGVISTISSEIKSAITPQTAPGLISALAWQEIERSSPHCPASNRNPDFGFSGYARYLRALVASVPFESAEPADDSRMELSMELWNVGCGVGWFSIPMARMVGDHGTVIAVDLQPQMLDMLRHRAEKAGMADRIRLHHCQQNRLGVDAEADFALVFAMLHEVPDQSRLLAEIHHCLKDGGKLLLAEPPIHVTGQSLPRR